MAGIRWTTSTTALLFFNLCFFGISVSICVASDVESSIAEALRLVESVSLDDLQEASSLFGATTLKDMDRQLEAARTEFEKVQKLKQQKQELLNSINTKHVDALIQTLKKIQRAELERRETPDTALQYDQEEVHAWILDLIDNESQKIQKSSSSSPNNNACLTKTQAVQYVHTALRDFAHDGIGKTDLLQHSGRIVHSMTSPTYKLPYYSAWMKYIPEDWEAFFPENYYQSMAPPETVLEPTVHPGSCWATAARPAKITLQLATSYIHAISIDHVSEHLVDSDRSSAPKTIKVYGLESLTNDDPVYMTTIVYDLEGRLVQTFPIGATATTTTTTTNDTAQNDNSDSTSCSATISESCGFDPRDMAVSAVQLEIVDNWGNPEYTCVYRIRVHGEPVTG